MELQAPFIVPRPGPDGRGMTAQLIPLQERHAPTPFFRSGGSVVGIIDTSASLMVAGAVTVLLMT